MPQPPSAPHKFLGLEDPYRVLVDAARDYAIFFLDPRGQVVSWNTGAARLKGYSAHEIIGRHFSAFYPPDAIERQWPQQELKAAREKGRFEDEGWRVRKDGTRFWANVVITALYDARGELRGFSKITRNLTERRAQEERLRHSEERFRLLVENVMDYAIIMLDPQGRVVSWNAGAERIKGYQPHEIIGQHFGAFYPAEARHKKWPEQVLATAREQGRFEDEGVRVRKDGSTFWANVVVTPVYGHDGALHGYAKVTRDLTDARRIEALEKAERQTTEFLAMLAHELRNPLAPIRNALHLLSRKPTSDPAEQWVREVLQRQTGQMTRLVDDLLDVSRVTRDSIVLENKTLDARNIARAALDASRQWFDERHQELTVSLGEEALFVEGDEVRLVQVLQNLLHNAAKFTADGGRIELAMRREGGEVLISVKDQGSGMTREMLESAFQLFHQGSQGLERRHGGLGVGLTLVQRLVMLHGGSVQAKSAGPGRGSEFIVRLPCGNAAGTRAASAETQGKKDSVSPKRVLVVDDNQDAANALRFLLEQDAHQVWLATDGAAGLAMVREHRPDVVLLDIGLPRLNGYEIAAQVRDDPQLKHTVIIGITGYGQQRDRVRSAAAGFDHHLVKPVDYNALREIFDRRD